MLPLIKLLKKVHLEIYSASHADDENIAGNFYAIINFFNKLIKVGPNFFYCPEARKSIVPECRAQKASLFCAENNLPFAIKCGSRHLGGFPGGFLGEKDLEEAYIQEKIEVWEESVEALSSVSSLSPHCVFAVFQKSMQ